MNKTVKPKETVKTDAMEAHPAAEAYRLMDDEELAGLVADIKANGLETPIVIIEHEGKDVIVDGRNRAKACEIAGVAPRFERLDQKIDPRTLVWSRGQRRNVTKGQQAMAFALIWPEPEKGGRGKKTMNNVHGFWPTQLVKARAVVAYSRDLALTVRSGSQTFDEAFKQAKDAKQALTSKDSELARLEKEAPDLFELVTEGRMKLNEAIAAQRERERMRAQAIEHAKQEANSGLSRFCGSVVTILLGASATEDVLVTKAQLDEVTDAYNRLKLLVEEGIVRKGDNSDG